MSEFELTAEFVEGVQDVVFPEDSTVANFLIRVGDDCLTRNQQRRKSRLSQPSDTVFGPVAGIADWFIENWGPVLWETHTPFDKSGRFDDLVGRRAILPGVREAVREWLDYPQEDAEAIGFDIEDQGPDELGAAISQDTEDVKQIADWQSRHLIGHASSNLAIPSIVVLPEDRDIVLSVDRLPTILSPSVEFLGPDKQRRSPTLIVVRKTAFKEEAKAFVEKVIEHITSNSNYVDFGNWLKQRWIEAQADERDPRKRLVWSLGDVAAARVEELNEERPTVARGLKQLLLDCRIAQDRGQVTAIEHLIDQYGGADNEFLSADKTAGWQIAGQDSVSLNQPDFAQGYAMARAVRTKLALGSFPIYDIKKKVFDRLDVKLQQEGCDTPLFRAAVCGPMGKSAYIIPSFTDPRNERPLGFRFAVVSALGRLLWQARTIGNEPIYGAQGDQAMVSQSRRAKAFAAEFLLPREALMGFGPDHPDLWSVADRYDVSRRMARWHASNIKSMRDVGR